MSQWRWNDVILEIDMADADFQERYENAFIKMEASEKAMVRTGPISGITRSYCNLFRNLFDDIYGEGTAVKLFGEKYNIVAHEEIYESWLSAVKQEVVNAEKRRKAVISKFRPKAKR